jgi:hypothetical protein
VELRDILVTPIVIMLVYAVGYFVRPHVTNAYSYRFFFPALSVKIVGALAVGFLYQFYYKGGDTFNYHTYGSRVIWKIFTENPADGLSLIFLPQSWLTDGVAYQAMSRIVFFTDPGSYFVIRVAAFIDLFTFSTYSATAVVFAALSFAGSWMMFLAFYRIYPQLVYWLALAIFFIPSVFFWGSGLLKDTLVMGALGMALYMLQSVFILRKNIVVSLFWLLVAMLTIYMAKKYVLLCFAPAAIMLVFFQHLLVVRSVMLRVLLVPAMIVLLFVTSYYSVVKIGEGDSKYAIDKLAITAQITAYDIGFYTGRDAGSTYSIGMPDGTFAGMLRMAPQAINVTLFRPYLWEARNPLMLVAAVESVAILMMTLFLIFRGPVRFARAFTDPYVLFCIIFSITFAFAVGVSTFNFGTLVRYKIPMMPFYVIGCILIYHHSPGRNAVESPDKDQLSHEQSLPA